MSTEYTRVLQMMYSSTVSTSTGVHRPQHCSVDNKTLTDVGLIFGVPQGSILGPKNYCMYTKLVGEIIKRYNIKYHCYVNYTQV